MGSAVEIAIGLLADTLAISDDDPSRPDKLQELIAHLKKEQHVLVARPEIVAEVLPFLESENDLVRWMMMDFTEEVCYRMEGMGDVKWESIATSAPLIAPLLSSLSVATTKRAILWLATVYPAAYWRACTSPDSFRTTWDIFNGMKDVARASLDAEHDGVRIAAVKFLEVTAVVHSNATAASEDLSLEIIPPGHPYLSVPQLKQEGLAAFNSLVELASSHEVTLTITTSAFSALLLLSRARPAFLQHLVTLSLSLSRTPVPHTWQLPHQKGYVKAVKNAIVGCLRLIPADGPEPSWASEAVDQLVSMGQRLWEFPQRFAGKAREVEKARQAAKRARVVAHAPENESAAKRPRMDPRTAQPSGQRPSHQNGSALPVPAPLLSGIPTPPPAADPHLAATQIAALQQIQQAQVVQQLNAAVASRFGVFPAPPQGTSVVLGGIDLGWLGPSAVAELVLRALQGISDAGLLGARAMLMARAAPALPVAPVAAPSARDPRRRDPRLASKKDREDTPEVVPKMETNLQPLFAPQSLPSSSALDSDYPRVPDISSPHLADPQTHLPILPSIEVSAAPLSSYLIPATPLTPENAQKIQVESLRRILSAEEAMSGKRFASARGMWQTVVARVVGRDPPSEKGDNGEAKVKSDNDVDNSKEIKDEMRSILVEHVCKDWKARNELCLLWLHEEYLSHPPTYFLWLHTVLLRLRTSLDSKDRMFTKFLLEVPELDESSIDVVRKYVEDKDRRGLGIATFRDLVVLRPAVKDDCLQAILEYTVSPDPEVRKPAIITIRRWYPDNSFVSPIAVKFALEQLESIGTLSQTNDSMEVDSGKDDANRETDGLLSSEVNRRVELAFALSSRRQELLRNVFALYSRANPSVQRCLHVAIAPLIRSIGMGSPVLLDLIRSPPEHGEGLVETVVAVLVERGARPSKELVDAIRNGRKEDQLGTTLLIAILPFSSKTEIFTALPKLLNLLDGDASSRETVKGCFVRLVQAANNTASTSQPSALTTPSSSGAEKPPLTATELLVHLHTMDDPANGGVAIKKVVEATQICLDTSDVFTQEVIAVVLQQLVDRPKLPTVFMRTMMQAVTKYKGLVGFSMGILTRLIGKRVWMDKTLWEGFVRCCRITQPYSFPVLLQLPKPQLQDILTRTTDMRAKLLQHVLSLPPQQRNTARIMNVMPLLMEQQGGPAASPSVNGTVTNQGASAGPGGVKVAS